MTARPTCALCGFRDAVTTTAWEDRLVPRCNTCIQWGNGRDPEPGFDPAYNSIASRVLNALGHFDEASAHDLCLAIDCLWPEGQNAVSAALGDLVRRGLVVQTYTGGRGSQWTKYRRVDNAIERARELRRRAA